MPLSTYLYQAIHSVPSRCNGRQDYAELCYWENGPGASARIVGLLIQRSHHTYYMQFGPASMKGVADREFSGLMTGQEGCFIASLDDAQLVEGLRRSQGKLPAEVSRKDFFEMGDGEKLALAKRSFSEAEQRDLRQLGKPTHQITLRTLDLDAMIRLMFQIKNEECLKFAPVAGSVPHQSNTENCASVIARLLEAGGAGIIVPSHNDELGALIPLPVFLMALVHKLPPMDVAVLTLTAAVIGRFVGGVEEGWRAANAISNLMQKEHKSYAHSATWGLRILDAAVSGVIGTLTWGSPTRKFLVLPEMLLDWAQKIEQAEWQNSRSISETRRARL